MPVRPHLRVALVVVAASAIAAASSCSFNPEPMYLMAPVDSSGPVCIHLEDPYSDRLCPMMLQASYFKPIDVTAETLVVRTSDGRNIRIALPNRTDAIFLTPSAMSTFLLRHYDATNPTRARELRTFMADNYRRR